MIAATGNLLDHARAYVAKRPPAISGAGGHDQTYAVACALVKFGLSVADAWNLLLEYNARCVPPWTERELQHKLQDSFRHARPGFFPAVHRLPYSGKTKTRIDPATAIENFLRGFRADEVDVWEVSPIRPPDDWTQDALCLLETLYHPGEQLNFVTAFNTATAKDGTVKANPTGTGETVERDTLLDRWRKRGLPRSDAGGWFRMNPVDGAGVTDSNVTAYRFALVECDSSPLDLQLSFFAKLALPVAAILASGGRSLHAWVKVDAQTAAEYQATVARLLALLARFGVDGKNKNPSRLSRLPGVMRTIGATGDGRQRLLYLNPAPQQKPILCPP
jgi:hypothetical protein